MQHLGHWHIRARQGPHHAKFPVYRVGRFQKLTGRLAAQDVIPAWRFQQESRVRLPGRELAHRQRALEAGDLRRAIECGELMLHYQPKLSAETGCLIGVEAPEQMGEKE